MKFKCAVKNEANLRRKTIIYGSRNTILLKAKNRSPIHKQSHQINNLNLKKVSKIPRPLFSSSPVNSFPSKTFNDSHISTLSNSLRYSSVCNLSNNISKRSHTHHYSIKTISENPKDHISDEAEILYCRCVQELWKKSQNQKEQTMQCQSLIDELENLADEKDKLKMEYTAKKRVFDTLKTYEHLKSIIDTEKTFQNVFCDNLAGLLPDYKSIVQSLEIQSNKLPVRCIYPAIPPSIENEDTNLYEVMENLNHLLQSGETIVNDFSTENLATETKELLKHKELISNLEECASLIKGIDDKLNLEIELRALNLSKSDDI